MNRRVFAKLAVAMGAAAAFGDPVGEASRVDWRERRELFPEGVASGDPDSTSVLLWTRCPHSRLSAAELQVEVAEDQQFAHVVASTRTRLSAGSEWTCRAIETVFVCIPRPLERSERDDRSD